MPSLSVYQTVWALASLLLWNGFMNASPALATEHAVTVDLDTEHQVMDNFGASDCWSMQLIGGWSLENRNRIADLLFSTTDGIGLSCWRFNLGAGKTDDIRDPLRTAETFEISEGVYDWSRQANEQWFLGAAKARGVEQFVAFVNSPPARMTRNGLTRCTPDVGTTNLKEGYEGQFARYLADILEHFRDHPDEALRIEFDWVSPVNEPQWGWNGNSQEGNRASNDDIKAIVLALHAELASRGLRTSISVVESGSMADMFLKNFKASYTYNHTYGNYLDAFCGDPAVNDKIGNKISAHSYWFDLVPSKLVPTRQKLREQLDQYPGWQYWMTEYCVMQGPEGKGGHGRDLTMDTALDVARVIHYDLAISNASAWQWWLAVSPYDYKDGLIYTDYHKEGDPETIYPSKLLWTLGNYSRFIRPGAVRVDLRGADESDGLLGSAYKDANANELILVFVNMAQTEKAVSLQLENLSEGRLPNAFTPYITSEQDDLKAYPYAPAGTTYTVPARSVVTLVGGFESTNPDKQASLAK